MKKLCLKLRLHLTHIIYQSQQLLSIVYFLCNSVHTRLITATWRPWPWPCCWSVGAGLYLHWAALHRRSRQGRADVWLARGCKHWWCVWWRSGSRDTWSAVPEGRTNADVDADCSAVCRPSDSWDKRTPELTRGLGRVSAGAQPALIEPEDRSWDPGSAILEIDMRRGKLVRGMRISNGWVIVRLWVSVTYKVMI